MNMRFLAQSSDLRPPEHSSFGGRFRCKRALQNARPGRSTKCRSQFQGDFRMPDYGVASSQFKQSAAYPDNQTTNAYQEGSNGLLRLAEQISENAVRIN